ncbi:MAG: hypothetical protein ACYSR1_09500, partial [Planctomycetota bacterium]
MLTAILIKKKENPDSVIGKLPEGEDVKMLKAFVQVCKVVAGEGGFNTPPKIVSLEDIVNGVMKKQGCKDKIPARNLRTSLLDNVSVEEGKMDDCGNKKKKGWKSWLKWGLVAAAGLTAVTLGKKYLLGPVMKCVDGANNIVDEVKNQVKDCDMEKVAEVMVEKAVHEVAKLPEEKQGQMLGVVMKQLKKDENMKGMKKQELVQVLVKSVAELPEEDQERLARSLANAAGIKMENIPKLLKNPEDLAGLVEVGTFLGKAVPYVKPIGQVCRAGAGLVKGACNFVKDGVAGAFNWMFGGNKKDETIDIELKEKDIDIEMSDQQLEVIINESGKSVRENTSMESINEDINEDSDIEDAKSKETIVTEKTTTENEPSDANDKLLTFIGKRINYAFGRDGKEEIDIEMKDMKEKTEPKTLSESDYSVGEDYEMKEISKYKFQDVKDSPLPITVDKIESLGKEKDKVEEALDNID